ncbi:hypothetical protein [Raoultibacter massiliensis]|uniref:Uncharacterized protein n=1 Tax=Raoultibacter massiliensis TaxID=1852371 RepID=A0ABV1JEC4_9ACTN
MVVKPSSRLYKALKDIMGDIYAQLLRIHAGSDLSPSIEYTISLLAKEFPAMKPGDARAEIDEEKDSIWNMEKA